MKMIEHLFKFIETNAVWDRTFPNYIQLLNVQLQQIRNIIFWYFCYCFGFSDFVCLFIVLLCDRILCTPIWCSTLKLSLSLQ